MSRTPSNTHSRPKEAAARAVSVMSAPGPDFDELREELPDGFTEEQIAYLKRTGILTSYKGW